MLYILKMVFLLLLTFSLKVIAYSVCILHTCTQNEHSTLHILRFTCLSFRFLIFLILLSSYVDFNCRICCSLPSSVHSSVVTNTSSYADLAYSVQMMLYAVSVSTMLVCGLSIFIIFGCMFSGIAHCMLVLWC